MVSHRDCIRIDCYGDSIPPAITHKTSSLTAAVSASETPLGSTLPRAFRFALGRDRCRGQFVDAERGASDLSRPARPPWRTRPRIPPPPARKARSTNPRPHWRLNAYPNGDPRWIARFPPSR